MPERHPEKRDVSARALLTFGGGFVLFLALSLLILFFIFGNVRSPVPFGAGTGLNEKLVPVPEREPRRERAAYEAEKTKALNSSGWVDQSAGIAHIPIEDAMRIIVKSGVPDWGQHRPAPRDAECALLRANVPRAPQAECANSADQESGK